MKFTVTMKDPDGVYESIDEAVKADVAKLGLPRDEAEAIEERRREKTNEIAARWFEYGEYLTVEIDTDAGTCVVVPRK